MDQVVPVRFENRVNPGAGIDVLRISQLRRRAAAGELGSTQRLDFNLLILVTNGGGRHVVDSIAQPLRTGDVTIVPAGHLHRFDFEPETEGIMVLFEDTFLLPKVSRGAVDRIQDILDPGRLPSRLVPGPEDRGLVEQRFLAIEQEYRRPDDSGFWLPTLRHSLVVLLLGLSRMERAAWAQGEASSPLDASVARAFSREVENSFRRSRCVEDYATAIGCTPRALNRMCQERFGKSAKDFISDRLILEAKRLLAHTDLLAIDIAMELGFTEATNFIKFFRSRVGQTPAAYRSGAREREQTPAPVVQIAPSV